MNLLVLPIIIPIFTAAVSLLAWRHYRLQKWLGLIGAAATLVVAIAIMAEVSRGGIQAVQMGGWPAPFGITLVADLFSAIMVLIAGVMAVTVAVYSLGDIDPTRQRGGFFPLYSILLAGVCGAFLTGDIFNLFVWFEVMLIASFVLLALGGERGQIEGAIKYVTLNLVTSALFLSALGILYGIAGTLNMADLSQKLQSVDRPGVVTSVAMMFLVAFGIKSAAFPLFFWLPASYHTPPVAVSAIFSALLTKVGVYALIRVFTLIFVQDAQYSHGIILLLAGLTMVTGVLGAVAQVDFRRLLSFHIISQIGYLLMGLGLFTPLGLAASVYFMAHVIVSKAALFLVSGIVHHLRGTYDLKKLGGLWRTHPLLAVLFIVPALSLAGAPPLSGFFAKLALVQGGLEVSSYAIVGAALAVSLLTLYSMTKIWMEAFWKVPPAIEAEAEQVAVLGRSHNPVLLLMVPTAVLAGLIIVMGLAAEPLFSLSFAAAEQMLDRSLYIEAVLGGSE